VQLTAIVQVSRVTVWLQPSTMKERSLGFWLVLTLERCLTSIRLETAVASQPDRIRGALCTASSRLG
jgi:hypothetical protein